MRKTKKIPNQVGENMAVVQAEYLSERKREKALRRLAAFMYYPQVVNIVIEVLRLRGWNVRLNAVQLLVTKIDHPGVIPALVVVLDDKDGSVSLASCKVLTLYIDRPGVIPALTKAVTENQHFFTRGFACLGIAPVVGHPETIDALKVAATDEHPFVRTAARKALGRDPVNS